MKNYFYVFEGIDGCGKTTLINSLKIRLAGKSFFFTKEPFGTQFNPNIKPLLYEAISHNDYISQYLLFAAERSYHIKTVINKHLNDNFNVISDRFFYSSLVYQGIHVDEDFIKSVYNNSSHGIKVKKIFFCRIPYEIALERINKRNINDTLDNYYKAKLSLLSDRYNRLFKNNPLVVTLDMTLSLEELIEKVMMEL